jgi:hypothetical protein
MQANKTKPLGKKIGVLWLAEMKEQGENKFLIQLLLI